MSKNILRRQEVRTAMLMAAIAAVTVLMLFLQAAGFLSLSLRSSAIYNPLPSYGPLRQDYSAQSRGRTASERSSTTSRTWHGAAASSVSPVTSSAAATLEERMAARRERVLNRQRQRGW